MNQTVIIVIIVAIIVAILLIKTISKVIKSIISLALAGIIMLIKLGYIDVSGIINMFK